MEAIVRLREVTKAYGRLRAVDQLNMEIRRGDIYGFLGRNGAGKTTAIRMIMGLIRPNAGTIELFGEPVRPDRGKLFRRVGAMIETPGFYANLTAWENLDLARRMMGLRGKEGMEWAIRTVGLWEERHRKASDFSLGMKQRLGIARAILHRPELLVLDEPTNGLDPSGIKEMRGFIRSLAEQGMTVLMSSHILSEVQQVARTVGVLNRGRLVKELAIAELANIGRTWVELTVDETDRARALLREGMGYGSVAEEGRALRIYDKVNDASEINRRLVMAGVRVYEIKTVQDSLETYFFQLTEGESA